MLQVREYGDSGPTVLVLHGGPAAVGSAAPLARGLADTFRVYEPWQRGSGNEPLTVVGHVADLHAVIEAYCPNRRPALVGESWGAMLALAYAAAHPDRNGPLALIGCGTFDPAARAQLHETRERRKDREYHKRVAQITVQVTDPAEQLMKIHALDELIDNYDPIPATDPIDDTIPPFDLRAHTETWADMMRLQERGVYPAAFSAITTPVIMLHGAYDPHPGKLIFAGLKSCIPHLEYHEWECCGHSPWVERDVRKDFFEVLKQWLLRNMKDSLRPGLQRPGYF